MQFAFIPSLLAFADGSHGEGLGSRSLRKVVLLHKDNICEDCDVSLCWQLRYVDVSGSAEIVQIVEEVQQAMKMWF